MRVVYVVDDLSLCSRQNPPDGRSMRRRAMPGSMLLQQGGATLTGWVGQSHSHGGIL
jgi:hypothetical protein